MLPGNINTTHQLVQYCREILAMQPEFMNAKEQESPAAALVGLGVNDNYDDWAARYPQLAEIFYVAGDLEWSNVEDPKESWQRILQLVDELEGEVRGASR